MGNAESQKRHHSESSGKESQRTSNQHQRVAASDDNNVLSGTQVRRMSAGDITHPPRVVTEEVESIPSNAKYQNKPSSTQNSSDDGMACTTVELSSDTNFDVSLPSNELSLEKETEPVVQNVVSCEEDFERGNDLDHVAVKEKLEYILESVTSMVEFGEAVEAAPEEYLFNIPTKCCLNKTDCTSVKDNITCVSAPIPHKELIINSFAEKLLKDTFQHIISDCDFNTAESKACDESLNSPHKVPTIVISSGVSLETFVDDTEENNISDVKTVAIETDMEQSSYKYEAMTEENVVEKVVLLVEELVNNVITDGLNSFDNNVSDIKKVRFDSEPLHVVDSNVVSEKNSMESHTDGCSSEINHSSSVSTEETLNQQSDYGATISSACIADAGTSITETANSDGDSKLVLLADNITTDIILSSLKLIESENNVDTVREVVESLLNTVTNPNVPQSSVTTNNSLNRNFTGEEVEHPREDSNIFGIPSDLAETQTAASNDTFDGEKDQTYDDEQHKDTLISADPAAVMQDVEISFESTSSVSVNHEAKVNNTQNVDADMLMIETEVESTKAGLETPGQSAMTATQSLSDTDVPFSSCVDQAGESQSIAVQIGEVSSDSENIPKDLLNDMLEDSTGAFKPSPGEFISDDASPSKQLYSDEIVKTNEAERLKEGDTKALLNKSHEVGIHSAATVENNDEGTLEDSKRVLRTVATEQNENNSVEPNMDRTTLEERNIESDYSALDDDCRNQTAVEKNDDHEIQETESAVVIEKMPGVDKNEIESTSTEDQYSNVVDQDKCANQTESGDIDEKTLGTEHSPKRSQATPLNDRKEDSALSHVNTEFAPESLRSEERSLTVLQSEQPTIAAEVVEKDGEKAEEREDDDEETGVTEKLLDADLSDGDEEMESSASRQQRLAEKGARLMKRKQQEAAGGMKLKSSTIKTSSTGSSSAVHNHSPSLSSSSDHVSTVPVENLSSVAELKSALIQLEEKYKQSMVQAAQLDNERSQLQYQTLQLKDLLEEQEDDFYRLKSEHKTSCQEIEKQKRTITSLQKKCNDLQESLKQRDELIQDLERKQVIEAKLSREVFDLKETLTWKDRKIEERGLVVVGEDNREDVDGRRGPNDEYSSTKLALVTPEAAEVLQSAGDGPLDSRLKHLAEEKQELVNQVRLLKFELEEERRKIVVNGTDDASHSECRLPEMQLLEVQREANKVVSEYKLKLQKSEQDIAACHGNIARLESQVGRLKQTSEIFEKNEDEMRAEKRKLMRDLRTALDRIEEMEMTNSHLEKRLERFRATRTAVNQT